MAHDGGSGPAVTWDYTSHARHYDKRADYSAEALAELLQAMQCDAPCSVAEVGAGTGKLTKELLAHGLTVHAVEPNDAMRSIGIANTAGRPVTWSVGTGEATGLASHAFRAVLFGSSFNVVDQRAALHEAARVLQPRGWFACMWNHRDLEDPAQKQIEQIIQKHLPAYSYGLRREDPTEVIASSGLFSPARKLARGFSSQMQRADIVEAWRSHATLQRQAGNAALFDRIIADIARALESLPASIPVPYTTRIYFAQLKH